jgi:hypothetical protein
MKLNEINKKLNEQLEEATKSEMYPPGERYKTPETNIQKSSNKNQNIKNFWNALFQEIKENGSLNSDDWEDADEAYDFWRSLGGEDYFGFDYWDATDKLYDYISKVDKKTPGGSYEDDWDEENEDWTPRTKKVMAKAIKMAREDIFKKL